MNRSFRKYHRLLAIISSLPLLITTLTGVGYSLAVDWLQQYQVAHFLMRLHTFQILKLGKFYPFLLTLSVLGLMVTGLSLTRTFRRQPTASPE